MDDVEHTGIIRVEDGGVHGQELRVEDARPGII
jgi:hypothetical protein